MPLHTPRRAIAPGTSSRYQEKSSPPPDCRVSASASGPMASIAWVTIWVQRSSLTTGGTPRRYCSECSMPSGASRPETISRTTSSITSQVSRLAVRTVPARVPLCGMALAATPALAAPHTITVLCRGSMRRDSTPGSPVISVPMPYTRSEVRCGREVCPPAECRVISIESAAEVIGPGMIATRPTDSRGSQCSAKIRDTPSSAPAAIASIAPPGINSSAAWKISRTPTGSSGAAASADAAPSSIAVWASCPQACATFGTVEAYGAPVRSAIGSASMSARNAMRGACSGPKSQVNPVPPGSTFGFSPASTSRSATNWVVANSWRPNSGWRWMCRRHSTRSS